MSLDSYLAAERGRCAKLALHCRVTAPFLAQVAAGRRPAPPRLCVRIERGTCNEVRRWDLRPADWHEIWPELVGAPGAPPVEARNAA